MIYLITFSILTFFESESIECKVLSGPDFVQNDDYHFHPVSSFLDRSVLTFAFSSTLKFHHSGHFILHTFVKDHRTLRIDNSSVS